MQSWMEREHLELRVRLNKWIMMMMMAHHPCFSLVLVVKHVGSPGLETEKFKRLTLTLTQRAEIHLQCEMGSHIPSALKKMFVWAMEGFDAHLIHYSKGLLFVKTFFLPVIFFLIRSAVSALFLFYLI